MPWYASPLSTYSQERHTIAEGLLEFDRTWSTMIGSKAASPDNPDAGGVSAEDVERQFTAGGRFTAGLSTQYGPSLLTGSDEHQQLAPGFEVGTRFHSAPVIRVSDAKPVQLGHVHRADGRWRLYAFADVGGLAEGSRLDGLVRFLAEDVGSPVRRFTPAGADLDAVFDLRVVLQQDHRDVDLGALPELLQPWVGRFGLKDYEKVFSAEQTNGRLLGQIPGLRADQDLYGLRGVDRERGALVVVRPDQYIAQVLPLDAAAQLAEFFAGFMLEQG